VFAAWPAPVSAPTAWPAPGLLGPPPVGPPAAAPPVYSRTLAAGGIGSWDQQALASTFNTMTLRPPSSSGDWYMDSSATSHMASHPGILSSSHPPCSSTPSSIIVGDGSYLPITATGSASVGNLHLENVLVSPQIIKNLVSVRRFTTDNNCSVEFDPRGFSVKDLRTRKVITRCNSSSPLYPMCPPVIFR
jgi:hypothetical protein